jgi:Gp5-like OB domain-containing protein
MASVFDRKSLTLTACPVPEAGSDNHIQMQGSAANWSAITEPTFLSGPKPGQEQVLIRSGDQAAQVAVGNRWVEIKQQAWTHIHDKEIRAVDADQELTVGANQAVQVAQNVTSQIGKNLSETIGEMHNKVAGKQIKAQTGKAITIMKDSGDISTNGRQIKTKGTDDIIVKGKKILENC